MEKIVPPLFQMWGYKIFLSPTSKIVVPPLPAFHQFSAVSEWPRRRDRGHSRSPATVRGSVNFRSLRRLYRADDFRFFLLTFHNVLIVLEVLMAFSEHLTVESYTVFTCQQSYLLLLGIPSPTNFHSRLKTFLFCKSFPPQPFFFFSIHYMDSPDCLLLFLSISVFYF